MPYLRCYRITHDGDPAINSLTLDLEFGIQDCMKQMRPAVNEGDWIAAELGKTYPLNRENETGNRRYLSYAMRVTSIENSEFGNLICSSRGNYYWFLDNFQEIPERFHTFLSNGQRHKNTNLRRANEFIEWIRTIQ